MTQEFDDMLQLLGMAITGQSHIFDHRLDVQRIKAYSVSQGVWNLVYPQLAKVESVPPQEQEIHMQAVYKSLQRIYTHLEVIEELEKQGITCCLLKGISAAVTYPEPDLRISGDTDVLVDEKDEPRVLEYLENHGYHVERRTKRGHHSEAFSEVGLMEIHVRFYGIPTEKLLLDGLTLYNEPHRKKELYGHNVTVLGINDGLMFLTAHYIKHFVNTGGGVRHMLDLLQYIKMYDSEIDYEKYNELLKKLHYDKLITVVKTIGAKYWGFDYPIIYEDLAEQILADTEAGGIFGHNSKERKEFYNLYCQKRSGNKIKSSYVQFFEGESDNIKKFFPTHEMLKSQGYRCTKFKWMYPIPWFERVIRVFLRRIRKENKGAGTATRIDNGAGMVARIDMMKNLGMLD